MEYFKISSKINEARCMLLKRLGKIEGRDDPTSLSSEKYIEFLEINHAMNLLNNAQTVTEKLELS